VHGVICNACTAGVARWLTLRKTSHEMRTLAYPGKLYKQLI